MNRCNRHGEVVNIQFDGEACPFCEMQDQLQDAIAFPDLRDKLAEFLKEHDMDRGVVLQRASIRQSPLAGAVFVIDMEGKPLGRYLTMPEEMSEGDVEFQNGLDSLFAEFGYYLELENACTVWVLRGS
jgi:hypothetical protein